MARSHHGHVNFFQQGINFLDKFLSLRHVPSRLQLQWHSLSGEAAAANVFVMIAQSMVLVLVNLAACSCSSAPDIIILPPKMK